MKFKTFIIISFHDGDLYVIKSHSLSRPNVLLHPLLLIILVFSSILVKIAKYTKSQFVSERHKRAATIYTIWNQTLQNLWIIIIISWIQSRWKWLCRYNCDSKDVLHKYAWKSNFPPICQSRVANVVPSKIWE